MSSDRLDAAASPASRPLKASVDVLVAAGAMLAAIATALILPGGSTLRLAVVLPVLMVAPGYLLLQALLVPTRSATARVRHALLSLGVSPAVLGLLALSTAIVPGGFTEGAILAVVTLGCLVLAGVSVHRRRVEAQVIAGEDEEDVTQTA